MSAETQSAVPPVRTRLRVENGEAAKGDGYDFYPSRALLEEEFTDIWECCDPRKFLQMRLESGPKEGPDDEAIEVASPPLVCE